MMRDNYGWREQAGTLCLSKKGSREEMRRLLLVSLLLAGCAGTEGPRMRDAKLQRVDPRGLSIPEQQQRARAALPYPNIQPGKDAPRTWAGIPEEQYGQRFSY